MIMLSTLVNSKDENGRKTPKLFSTFIFEYEDESESGKAGNKNKHELMKISKMNQIKWNDVEHGRYTKINTEYRPIGHEFFLVLAFTKSLIFLKFYNKLKLGELIFCKTIWKIFFQKHYVTPS
jgi:hypothetical protein